MNVNEEQTFVTLCSLFILHNMLNKLRECEASHSNKATLSQLDLGCSSQVTMHMSAAFAF